MAGSRDEVQTQPLIFHQWQSPPEAVISTKRCSVKSLDAGCLHKIYATPFMVIQIEADLHQTSVFDVQSFASDD